MLGGGIYGGLIYGGADLIGGPEPPPPPIFGAPGKMERVQAQGLHSQPGNQLERTGVQSLHRQIR
jgi:hypothetical protein